jgi:hypothetical protein
MQIFLWTVNCRLYCFSAKPSQRNRKFLDLSIKAAVPLSAVISAYIARAKYLYVFCLLSSYTAVSYIVASKVFFSVKSLSFLNDYRKILSHYRRTALARGILEKAISGKYQIWCAAGGLHNITWRAYIFR